MIFLAIYVIMGMLTGILVGYTTLKGIIFDNKTGNNVTHDSKWGFEYPNVYYSVLILINIFIWPITLRTVLLSYQTIRYVLAAEFIEEEEK